MATPTKVDTRWFKNRIADRHMSQRKLAATVGMDPGALSLAFHGKRKLSADEVSELARILKVDAAEVLTRAGAGAPTVRSDVTKEPVVTGDGNFEAEFMQKWVALGMMLMRNRGPL
ncbi:HTH_XRE domain containing protein [uncultured Caudovirales phage]|uniref:HTH_XRE domain containing protein n=1 Tax=uncultured Caudovirales phage TaxID=2100421 RepID=A0A6J7W335_9CAUD|nr:HTH_XRE domain containing protein [uncultured Caudovirales phage]